MAVLEAWSFWKPVLMTPECNLTKAFELNAAIEKSRLTCLRQRYRF